MMNPFIPFVVARLKYLSSISKYCFVTLPGTSFDFGKNTRSTVLLMTNASIALNEVVINLSSLRRHLLARSDSGVGLIERRIRLFVWRVILRCVYYVRNLLIQVRNAKRTRMRLVFVSWLRKRGGRRARSVIALLRRLVDVCI